MYVWFLFSKTVFCFTKQGKQEKYGKLINLVPYFFFVKNSENKKNTKLKKQEQFSENIKMMFFMFSQTVLKNMFKNRKQTIP